MCAYSFAVWNHHGRTGADDVTSGQRVLFSVRINSTRSGDREAGKSPYPNFSWVRHDAQTRGV
jgi:hypothetical protein